MSKWRINANQIQTVLNKVIGGRDALAGVFSEARVTSVFDGVSSGRNVTAPVANAVSNLLTDQQADMRVVGNHVNAGILGVSNATLAYNNGQESMIGTFQSEMSKLAVSGDFEYFKKYGKTE